MSETPETAKPEVAREVARNEPCPCGSGKKYKRCCGVAAAPKLGAPRAAMPDFGAMGAGAPAGGGFSPDQMDPAAMAQVAQMLQRLPKGQMQKLQSLMQQAMSGKDVSREAAAFEQSLPVDFQNMLHTMKLPGMPEAGAVAPADAESGEMTADQARKLVEDAAKSGKISAEEAAALLQGPASEAPNANPEDIALDAAISEAEKKSEGGISKLFRWGKK